MDNIEGAKQREGVLGSPPDLGSGYLVSSNLTTLTKTCGKCLKTKSLEDFHRRGEGFQSWCKDCRKSYDAKWWNDNKERLTPTKAKRRREKREWFASLKSKYKCNRCPENHPATLQFHHLDPSQKDASISYAVAIGWSQKRIEAEMMKCEVLCANCHAKEHWEDGSMQLE